MCSVADDDHEGEKYMIKEDPQDITQNSICVKCKKQAEVVLRKKDLYCNECFLAATVHKFRANFGKTRLIKPGMNVLIAHSGDKESSALLYLVKNGMEESVYKKLKFNPIVLYIDEGAVHQIGAEDRQTQLSNVKTQIESFELPYYIADINEAMIFGDSADNSTLDGQILNLFQSVTSLTSRHDLLKKLRRKLLTKHAKIHDCTHVLLGDTSTQLAAASLINISLGGGTHIASDIGFLDSRDQIKILRPMRDFTLEELDLYIGINKISYIPHKSMSDKSNQYASIQSRIKCFIDGLQENFPATVSTVLRTSNKMESSDCAEDEQCALCQSILDGESDNYCSAQATAFSKEMSNKSIVDKLEACSVSDCNQGCSCSGKNSIDVDSVSSFLCYECRSIVKDVKDVNALPRELITDVKIRKERQSMKSAIQDYLL